MLTPKQQEVLRIIHDWYREHRFAPTISEIAKALGVNSRSMVQRIIDHLEQTGYLMRVSGMRRNLKLLRHDIDSLPVLGRVKAGEPNWAISDEEMVNFRPLVGENRFVLKVSGDSMIDDHICDGDLVVCERCVRPEPGEIVVALVRQDEATIKRIEYHPDTKTICLRPSNPRYNPQYYFDHEVEIQGRFVALVRYAEVRHGKR